MQIPIIKDPAGVNNWSLLEFQGHFVKSDHQSEGSVPLGDLHWSRGKNNPGILIVGHHVFTGKNMNDDGSGVFLLLSKKKKTEESESVEYNIKAVIKRALIFKARPKPMVVLATINQK
ncbi:CTF8 [Lepeophtheirus salmonis]|uniref:CTF8 n=2 Tax=Lepeophtheirus salmonis TaxID=72036 RepID=A0A7R8D232_LEPSM|nr:uncharacterized protein LOC121120024 [Lepeophtheirus salmonis]CAB4066402.1 CTF8 [Lepeophtheirus salmonis]CAF2971963.1 CTF8 [Lepeophtheirus salmonis]